MKKLSSLILALGMIFSCSISAFAAESQPAFAPANPNEAKTLIDVEEFTYEVDGKTVTETVKTYVYNNQPRSGEQKFYKNSVCEMGEGSGYINLDADFWCDRQANTVRCTRYYSSYDLYTSFFTPPQENEKSEDYGTALVGGKTYAKIKTRYGYQVAVWSTYEQPRLSVGCDSTGNTVR